MQLPAEIWGVELQWWCFGGAALWAFGFVVLAKRAFTIDDPPPVKWKWGDAQRRQLTFRERAMSHVGPAWLVTAVAALILHGFGAL